MDQESGLAGTSAGGILVEMRQSGGKQAPRVSNRGSSWEECMCESGKNVWVYVKLFLEKRRRENQRGGFLTA